MVACLTWPSNYGGGGEGNYLVGNGGDVNTNADENKETTNSLWGKYHFSPN